MLSNFILYRWIGVGPGRDAIVEKALRVGGRQCCVDHAFAVGQQQRQQQQPGGSLFLCQVLAEKPPKAQRCVEWVEQCARVD